MFNSSNLNLFAYAHQNPVKYIDPNGLVTYNVEKGDYDFDPEPQSEWAARARSNANLIEKLRTYGYIPFRGSRVSAGNHWEVRGPRYLTTITTLLRSGALLYTIPRQIVGKEGKKSGYRKGRGGGSVPNVFQGFVGSVALKLYINKASGKIDYYEVFEYRAVREGDIDINGKLYDEDETIHIGNRKVFAFVRVSPKRAKQILEKQKNRKLLEGARKSFTVKKR
ncbi:MAG TPA: hypothetical protein ENI73_08340 [Spirochaetes bacterium]|nr:hypothetical protein [Spirochaetota bacterium]